MCVCHIVAQLADLIHELDATGLHFVRCIKPNFALKPHLWEENMALHQLKCCGVLEVARIAAAGYPTRYTHQVCMQMRAVNLRHVCTGTEPRTCIMAPARCY